jgi:glutathione S-transferase
MRGMTVELHGYSHSVYRWIARLALVEKGVAHTCIEVNPFVAPIPPYYLAMHPFGRVPTLVYDGFVLYETNAITRYIDEAFPGPGLQPTDARSRARMQQMISVVDSYGYWPMARQVFSHGVFRPRQGLPGDPAQVATGLASSERVLGALEHLAGDRSFLVGDEISLADIHLAPMMAYFAAEPAAAALLSRHSRLQRWWTHLAERPTVVATMPG